MTTPGDDYYAKNDSERLIADERRYIQEHRKRLGQADWYAVALSGGGIRSAIFCLGALQALAAKNILPSFDYLSSVSGGGYIASALQWVWRIDPASGSSSATFPFGATRDYRSNDPKQDARLTYLRTHGQYLIPDEKLSIWSLVAVVIRTLFLNLAVWLPIGAFAYGVAMLLFRFLANEKIPNLLAFVMAPKWRNECVGDPVALCKAAADSAATQASAAKIPLAKDACAAAAKIAEKTIQPDCVWPLDLFFNACLAVGLLWVVGLAIWAIAFSLDTRISSKQEVRPSRWFGASCLAVSIIVGYACLCMVIEYARLGQPEPDSYALAIAILLFTVALIAGFLAFLQNPGRTASANYTWRRTFEVKAGWSFPWITILIALGTIPVVPYLLINKAGFAAKAAAAAVSLISGIYSGVFGHRAQADESAPTDLSRWVLMFASAVFIYSVAVVAYCIAQLWFAPDVLLNLEHYKDSNGQTDSAAILLAENLIRAGIMVWAIVALALAGGTNVNYVGLHRFYRDRLMEAFMPTPKAVQDNVVDFSPTADRLSLAELWPPSRDSANPGPRDIPYPIINTNAILMNDPDRLLSWRGGDNFIFSPLAIGSSATGWERTGRYMKKNGPITLPSAMATSGAAINANAAYVGAGVTRDRLVSIVLMLLNLRLGMWAARPDEVASARLTHIPNHWSPSFRYGMTRMGYRSTSSFVELTDGGHFDNSGIYELARRKCAFIVAVDGEEDPKMALPALYSVAQRIREDFKAKIDLDGVLDELIPEKGKGYPEGISFVTRPYFVAPISYADGSRGVLVYVKLSLAQGLGFDALGYRAQHADFPHQPTMDQFFVPEQVEAYRNVGFTNMEKAIEELSLQPGAFVIPAVLAAYQNRPRPEPAAEQVAPGAQPPAVPPPVT